MQSFDGVVCYRRTTWFTTATKQTPKWPSPAQNQGAGVVAGTGHSRTCLARRRRRNLLTHYHTSSGAIRGRRVDRKGSRWYGRGRHISIPINPKPAPFPTLSLSLSLYRSLFPATHECTQIFSTKSKHKKATTKEPWPQRGRSSVCCCCCSAGRSAWLYTNDKN